MAADKTKSAGLFINKPALFSFCTQSAGYICYQQFTGDFVSPDADLVSTMLPQPVSPV